MSGERLKCVWFEVNALLTGVVLGSVAFGVFEAHLVFNPHLYH